MVMVMVTAAVMAIKVMAAPKEIFLFIFHTLSTRILGFGPLKGGLARKGGTCCFQAGSPFFTISQRHEQAVKNLKSFFISRIPQREKRHLLHLRLLFREILHGVYWTAVNTHFKVQMRAGRVAGGTHISDNVALIDILALLHGERGAVPV